MVNSSTVFHTFDQWVVKFSTRLPIENFTTSYHVVVKYSMCVVTFSMVVKFSIRLTNG
jgi:hypothetical protein